MEQSEIQAIADEFCAFANDTDDQSNQLVQKALNVAIEYHAGQLRASSEPYYEHPIAVARIIAQMGLDISSIITAILHDTIEDTELTMHDIEKLFGPKISMMVDGVTKLTRIEMKKTTSAQAENLRKLLLAMSNDIRILIVKLADRLHNMRTIKFLSSGSKRRRISLETLELYAPLAERIGIHVIKNELQDIAFGVLYPKMKQYILHRFSVIKKDTHHVIDNVLKHLYDTISGNGKITPGFKIAYRKKMPYSTWIKIKQKRVGIDELCDIIAFRIIVNTVEECYSVLGIVHMEYTMVPNNFQDFISIQKPNGYESIHTVVIGPNGHKIEIQIRTHAMHHLAEWGVAAHWKYKQECKNALKIAEYDWLQELISMSKRENDSQEFLENTKRAMHYNQVFCFTPRGKIITLPSDATCLDFAYALDPEIGHKCTGARVNGKIVSLNVKLNSGDLVEILVSNTSNVCSDWANIVTTGRARSHVQQFLRENENNDLDKQEEEFSNTLIYSLHINVVNSSTSFAEITKIVAELKSNIVNIQILNRTDISFDLMLDVEICYEGNLQKLVDTLSNLDCIDSVEFAKMPDIN